MSIENTRSTQLAYYKRPKANEQEMGDALAKCKGPATLHYCSNTLDVGCPSVSGSWHHDLMALLARAHIHTCIAHHVSYLR